jgi:hypothetical protein
LTTVRKATRLFLLVVAVVATVIAMPTAAAAKKKTAVDKVLIVSTPRLTWRLVDDARPPNLLRLLQRSAVASMSLRTVSARTTIGEGYATIGAGNRASVVDLTAGHALEPTEPFEGSSAAQVYLRRTSRPATGGVLELGLAQSVRRNKRLLYGAHLGELGAALHRHGRTTAVIANADADPATSLMLDNGLHREAALALMDRDGTINGGAVSPQLLVADPTAPYDRRFDPALVKTAFEQAWAAHDVVLFELSDLERADAYGDVATTAARHDLRVTAMQRSDSLLGQVLATIDPAHTLVVVVTPAAPRAGEQLGVAAIAGPGTAPGRARSGTTRRAGYATLADVAPTVLDALDLEAPHAMTGTPITSSGGRAPNIATVGRLAADNDRAVFRDRATGPVSVVFVVFQVLVYAAGAAALARGRPRRFTAIVALLALTVLAMPLVGFLSGLVRYDHLAIGGYIGAFFAAAITLAAGAWFAGRRQPLVAPLVLIGATLVVLIIDVLLGGRLQLDTVFGYSPIVAGRFSGYGNLAYGLLAMSAIVVATIVWALFTGRRWVGWGVAGILLVTLVVDGAPPWGSDVGGVLASGPAFIVLGALLTGRRVGWRRLAAAVGATVAALTVFALVDLARPASERTHLGRFVANPGEMGDVVRRKLLSNLSILTSSVWTLIIPVALAFLVFLAVRPPGLLQQIQRRVVGLRACLIAGLLAGLLGFAVNDSGVAVPSMMLAVLLPYLTFLLARTE